MKWKLAELKDKDDPLYPLSVRQGDGVSDFSVSEFLWFYFLAQMLFSLSFSRITQPPHRILTVRISTTKKKKKKKYRTHRNPLFMFLIHCGISCHSDGCPHTHFIIRGSHQVFSPRIFFKQQQTTLLLNKPLIYLYSLSWQFLTRLHLPLTSGTISHAPEVKLILWRAWCWFAFSLVYCWVQYIMNTKIWGWVLQKQMRIEFYNYWFLILFSEILFLFIFLVLVYGFSIFIF